MTKWKKNQTLSQEEPDTMQLETVLRVENLAKTYAVPHGKLHILQDISFQVHRGEFLAITGQSGSGKTTLLSLLGALDSPDSGEIWLEEVAVHRLSGPAAADFRRQKVGFVFQLFYLLPNLTALENVMAPLQKAERESPRLSSGG